MFCDQGGFNSVQTRCIVKGEAQKSPLSWRFSGGFWFSQDRLFSRNSTRKPLNSIKSPIFTNAPCKTACLGNAPSMHTSEVFWTSLKTSLKTSEENFLLGCCPLAVTLLPLQEAEQRAGGKGLGLRSNVRIALADAFSPLWPVPSRLFPANLHNWSQFFTTTLSVNLSRKGTNLGHSG